jgi:hypothetical protein
MAQPKGTQYIIFRPKIMVAELGTQLPPLNLPLGGDWNAHITPGAGVTEWHHIPHTEEGCVISPSAPKDDIPSDEAGGAIGVVPSGESEITISFTPLTYDLDLFTWLASLQIQQEVAAVTNADPTLAFPAYKRIALTPEGKQFMFGVEGTFQEGTLTDAGGFVRAFGYKVEQTNEVDVNMRRTGDDAVVRLEAEVRCLVTTVSAEQMADTGITATDQRFDMFVVPNVA